MPLHMPPSPTQVLVIDDEPDFCALTKEFLEMSGEMEVDITYSVREARNALAKKRIYVERRVAEKLRFRYGQGVGLR